MDWKDFKRNSVKEYFCTMQKMYYCTRSNVKCFRFRTRFSKIVGDKRKKLKLRTRLQVGKSVWLDNYLSTCVWIFRVNANSLWSLHVFLLPPEWKPLLVPRLSFSDKSWHECTEKYKFSLTIPFYYFFFEKICNIKFK